MDSISGLIVLLVLVLLQGVLTTMYSALSNARKAQIKDLAEDRYPGAELTLKLIDNPLTLLAVYQFWSILLIMLSTGVAIALLAPEVIVIVEETRVSTDTAEVLTYGSGVPILTIILLIFSYHLPAALAIGRDEKFTILVSRPMSIFYFILYPLVTALQTLSVRVSRVFGVHPIAKITEEEIKTLVDAGSEDGMIEDEEKAMIYSVFKFGDTLAREVMVPRIDMVAIDIKTDLKDALDTIIKAGHSRIPVYEDTIDNIKGLLYAKDLLNVWQKGEATADMASLLRAPYFVPESKKAADLLEEFQTRKVHLAIVIDEYGGTAGLVTLEDLIEEIVGEIRDEYDLLEEEEYEKISETEYICDAGLDLDDLNELLDVELATDESDTLGGFIFTALGKVPEVGDKVVAEGIEMEVLTLSGRRIQKVRVTKIEDVPDDTPPVSESELVTPE
ncbi:MAG: hemolysin family protein [Anaerolineae bacterium]|nr:hemolysin family protein [Anaerolineae bacterium]